MRLSLILAALAFAATAYAQTAPKGWKVETNPAAWIATSPEHVKLAFYPAVKNAATFVYWFEDEGLRHTYAYGRTIRSQEATKTTTDPDAGALLAQARVLEEGGARFAVLSYAWQTPKGKQLAQIVMPGSVSRDSPAYKAALDEITAAWKSRFAYQPSAPPS
jgi:hypothetical protein